MNNLQKLINIFKPVEKGSWDRLWLRALESKILDTGELHNPYKQVSWIYIAINAIAKNVAQVPWKLYRGEEEIDKHPLLDLLNHVNPLPYSSQFWLFEITTILRLLRGNVVWVLEKSSGIRNGVKGSLPSAIYVFDIENFRIVEDAEGNIVGYVFHAKKGDVPFAPEEVLTFPIPSPEGPNRWMSPLEAIKLSYETDWEAQRYNRNFFKNSAEPGGAIIVDQPLSDVQFKRILEQFENRHGGTDKAHRLALIEGGGKYQSFSLSQRDMDFLNQRRMSREEILAAFGVPKTIVSLTDDLNYSIAQAHKKIFWNDTILPIINFYKYNINTNLVKRFIPEEGIELRPDLNSIPELQEDLREKAELAKILYEMGFTANEINDRLELGFDKKPWRDKWWIGLNMMPVSEESGESEEEEEETVEESIASVLTKLKGKRIPGIEGVEQRDTFWARWIAPYEKWESKMNKEAKSLWNEMKEENLNAIRENWNKFDFSGWSKNKIKERVEKESLSNLLFDEFLMIKRWKKAMKPLITGSFNDAGQSTFEFLQISGVFDVANPNAVKWIEKRSLEMAKSVVGTAKEEVREILREGYQEGLTASDIASRVEQYYDANASWKAARIARTETMMASNAGLEEAYRQSEVVEAKEWLTAKDERTCDICGPMDGRIVKLEDSFPEDGPPAHPNCRCMILPVLKEKE